jgi:hypothetical protein
MSNVLKAIKKLKPEEKINIFYNDKEYELKAYAGYKNKVEYSIWSAKGFQGMNVEKITSKYITLYDYNLFNVRSTYKIPVNEIIIKTKDIPGFEGTLEALNEITILK